MRKLLLAFSTLLSILITSNTNAQEWVEIGKALPITYLNSYNCNYGNAVSMDGNYAVVAERRYISDNGCAFILYYNGNDWIKQARLSISNNTPSYLFVTSVSISGDYVVIGANESAYVYKKPVSGWIDMNETAILTASDMEPNDNFGSSVSIYGDCVVVGAFGGSNYGTPSGSAYIFEKPIGGWMNMTESAIVSSSDSIVNDKFGCSVDISGDYIVVGAYGDSENGIYSGSAYIYKKSASRWESGNEIAKLTASDSEAYDEFGYSVNIDGNNIVVGAKRNGGGSAYVFSKPVDEWITGIETAILTASDNVNGDYFGSSVSISNDQIAIGAYGDDDNGSSSGSVYLYEKPMEGWINNSENSKIIATDGLESDYFASSISISGSKLIVGAMYSDENDDNNGSVYLYEKDLNEWSNSSQNKIVQAEYTNINDYYGTTVSNNGEYSIIGSPGYKNNTGCAYVVHHKGNKWETVAKLTSSDSAVDDEFGCSVDIYGDYVVIGATGDNDNSSGSKSGSAYVFKKPETGWEDMTETAKLTATDAGIFGYAVGISGNYIVVGAKRDQDNIIGVGSAYVYEKPISGWVDMTETAKLSATSIDINDMFGTSVDISGDYIVVGAYKGLWNYGVAYVYKKPETGWVDIMQIARLRPSDGISNELFGRSVSISGDVIAVSAIYDENQKGSVYVFEKPAEGWINMNENAKLTGSNCKSLSCFGKAVGVFEDKIVASSTFESSVYIFNKPDEGWVNKTENKIIKASDSYYYDRFGTSINISDNEIIVGASENTDNGYCSGSAYLFEIGKTYDYNNTLCEGADFSYIISGFKQEATFQWQMNSSDSWIDLNGYTNDTLLIPNVSLDMNNYQYRCIISETDNDTSEVATLNVILPFNETEVFSICYGSEYTFPDGTLLDNITSKIVHTSNLQSVFGCDSIIETTIEIDSLPISEYSYVEENGKVTFTNGSAYAESYSWDFDDGSNSIEESPIHNYLETGDYNVILDATNDCGTISSQENIEIIITGINDIKDIILSVYPNPVQDKLIVDYEKGIKIEFYNLVGLKVLESDNTEIDVSSLVSGTYIVLIKNSENILLRKIKIVKE